MRSYPEELNIGDRVVIEGEYGELFEGVITRGCMSDSYIYGRDEDGEVRVPGWCSTIVEYNGEAVE